MKHAPYIAVIDPAFNRPELECLNQLAGWSELRLSYHLPKLLGVHTMQRLQEKPAGILIFGSAASVNDGYDWQREMNDWLLPHMKAGVPTMGLCYGHQLICHLFGSKVSFMKPDKEKLRGTRTVSLKKNPLWGDAVTGELAVTHCEWVENCPKDFVVAGESPQVPLDVVAHKELPIWGFQSHPEATPHFFQTVASPESPEKNRVLTPKELELGHQIVKAFLNRCFK